MKTKKLVKNAIKHPEFYTPAELQYFKLWLASKKERKAAKKKLGTAHYPSAEH